MLRNFEILSKRLGLKVSLTLLSQIVERLLFLRVMMVWKVLREAVVLDHDCCSFLSPETVLLLSLKTVSDIITLTQHQDDDDDDPLTLVNYVCTQL